MVHFQFCFLTAFIYASKIFSVLIIVREIISKYWLRLAPLYFVGMLDFTYLTISPGKKQITKRYFARFFFNVVYQDRFAKESFHYHTQSQIYRVLKFSYGLESSVYIPFLMKQTSKSLENHICYCPKHFFLCKTKKCIPRVKIPRDRVLVGWLLSTPIHAFFETFVES